MHPFINIHTHTLRKSADVISIYNLKLEESIPDSTFSCGIHPWHINPLNYYAQIKNLEKQLSYENAIFIGECGLDKLKCSDFKLQQTVFQLQINLAVKHQKPMILHCVRAFDEILAMLKNKVSPDKIIFHGFHKSPEMAFDLTSKGYSISLGKSLFLQSERMKTVFEKINPNKMFFETDDSEYTIEEVYQKAVEISGQSLDFWKNQINQNFEKLTIKA
jgi:TatD DNase family protein